MICYQFNWLILKSFIKKSGTITIMIVFLLLRDTTKVSC